MDKLAKVLMAASLNNPGFDHATIDMIFCDVKDEQSINDMAAQTKVLLNCVGPYRYSNLSLNYSKSLNQTSGETGNFQNIYYSI